MASAPKVTDNALALASPLHEGGSGASKLRHIAIIMDGNRRWAKVKGLPVELGHYRGAEAARRTIKAAAELGISYLTLFGFSSENWNRAPKEVEALMALLRRYLQREVKPLQKGNVRLKIIGDRSRLQPDVIEQIEKAEALTAGNTGLNLAIAFSYGGRAEIAEAAKKWTADILAGRRDLNDLSEESFGESLLTAGMPDPDLIIRTSGEKRLSNFLLWQSAYAEFVFFDKFWPDFGKDDIVRAIEEFHQRERRYGAIA